MNQTSIKRSIREMKSLVDLMKEYYQNIESYPIRVESEPGALKEVMPTMFSETKREPEDLLKEFMEKCIPLTTHWQHPMYFAYFSANALPTTVIGEMMNTAINEGFNLHPGITDERNIELEHKVMDWIVDL